MDTFVRRSTEKLGDLSDFEPKMMETFMVSIIPAIFALPLGMFAAIHLNEYS